MGQDRRLFNLHLNFSGPTLYLTLWCWFQMFISPEETTEKVASWVRYMTTLHEMRLSELVYPTFVENCDA